MASLKSIEQQGTLINDCSAGRISRSHASWSKAPLNSVSNSFNVNFDKIIGSGVVRDGTTLLGAQISSNKSPLGFQEFVGSGGTQIYIDGKLEATDATTTTTKNVTGATPSIGWDTTGNNDWFNGSIDELIVESVYWTAQKVRNYYNQTKGQMIPKMI